jgi:hypothetical protein
MSRRPFASRVNSVARFAAELPTAACGVGSFVTGITMFDAAIGKFTLAR